MSVPGGPPGLFGRSSGSLCLRRQPRDADLLVAKVAGGGQVPLAVEDRPDRRRSSLRTTRQAPDVVITDACDLGVLCVTVATQSTQTRALSRLLPAISGDMLGYYTAAR